MTALLFGALWVHLAACVLLTGGLFLLLLAGPPTTAATRRWERRVLAGARWLAVAALASGVVWLAARTALFEGRPEAALEVRAVWGAMLNTWPGLVWMARQGLLVILAALLLLSGGDVSVRRDWLALRGEAFLLAALALILQGSAGHAAAVSESVWPRAVATVHLLGAGIWVGALLPLALLMHVASRDPAALESYAARTVRRFSSAALVTVLVLAGTGIAAAWLLVGGIAGLVGTAHGLLLLAKLAVLAPALLLAAASRAMLPALSSPDAARRSAAVRRMASFIAIEGGLVLVVLGLAVALTVTTPGRHADPVWPLATRPSIESWSDLAQSPVALVLGGLGLGLLAVLFLARRRPVLASTVLVLLLGGAAAIALRPLMVEAYPTSFAKPPITYHAGSIAEGMAVYRSHCAACHGAPTPGMDVPGESTVDLRAPRTTRRSAGELYWLISHGRPERGMPEFGTRLGESERWHLVNFLRAFGTTADPRRIGTEVEPDNAWLVAPDFTISVGPLTPGALRDYRGRRMVLLVLYAQPESAGRMTELARRYGALSVLGVEVVAVSPRSASEAIADLGASPPVLFPVVTDGNEEIVAAYRLFAPGTGHAELLIDRQGYVRAAWLGDRSGMPDAAAVQAQVERLNEEKSPPPLPDDHVH